MKKIIKTCVAVLFIGILGAIFSQTSVGAFAEEEIGLTWLFHLRGGLPAPADVIIISLDQQSTEILHLPDNPDDWSRSFYITLLEKLNQQAPALIAFNVHFGYSKKPEEDGLFAKAIARNKNVVLSCYLKHYDIAGGLPGAEQIYSERIFEPIPAFNQAAIGSAPFPIPKTSSTVKQFWTYKHSAGDIATLPVSVFQLFALKQAYPEMLQILNEVDRQSFVDMPASFAELVAANKTRVLANSIQSLFSKDSNALEKFAALLKTSHYSSLVNRLLTSWSMLFKEGERLYLNYYGDVGSITTIPFYQVITPNGVDANLFRNKIVLVGYADNLEPEKQQGFYSVFSKTSGKVISPIEIAGTALANILDQSWLKSASKLEQFLLILFWGVFLSVLFRFLKFRRALVLALVSLACYAFVARYLFLRCYLWLPIFIPVLQLVLLIIIESSSRYSKIRKLSEYYLPKEVFTTDTLDLEAMGQYGELKEGVCIATDAGQYTTLSEQLKPLELHKLMNDYYAAIFPLVKKHNGIISDVQGDAMFAIWSKVKADTQLRMNACQAALDIVTALEQFNQTSPWRLFTRMGLHFGEMRLGNVGASHHYEFRAVGDTVNTAARIEGLNKLLGTRVLASANVMVDLTGYFSREVGTFLLKGKANPVKILEIIGHTDLIAQTQPHFLLLVPLFAQAFQLYEENRWQEALALFLEIAEKFPDDGPTAFYINYLQKFSHLQPEANSNQTTVIDIRNVNALLI